MRLRMIAALTMIVGIGTTATTPAQAQPQQTAFKKHADSATSTLASSRGIGGTTFTVAAGEGSRFSAGPGRIAAIQAAGWDATAKRVKDPTKRAMLTYTSRSGDVFAGVAVQSGTTDLAFNTGDVVADLIDAADFDDLAAAVNAIEGATTRFVPGAHLFYAGSDGVSAAAFRALLAADIPTLDASKIGTGLVPTARGGTGVDGSAAANGSLLIGNGTGYTLAPLTAGSNVTITTASGGITIAAAVSGGGINGAAGRFSIADSYNGLPGASPGLALTLANVNANDAAIERAYQAATAYTAATGHGASIYVPAGNWLFSKAIWLDQPDMQLVGDGYASVLSQVGAFGPTGPLVVACHSRIQNGEAIPDDTYADASGVLDTSIAPSTYNWFGRRLKSLTQPTAGRQFYHIPFPNANLSAFRDYWYSCQQVTFEFAYNLNSGAPATTGMDLFGFQDDAGDPAPVGCYKLVSGEYEFRFATADLNRGYHALRFKAVDPTAAFNRVAVMIDLAAGQVSVIHNGTVLTQGNSAIAGQWTLTDPAGGTPLATGGLHFRRNERGMTFGIGSVRPSVHNPPSNQNDVTWYGMWFGDYRKYQFGAGGTAPVQDTSKGDTAATINDAFRYKLAAQNGRQVFYLDGSKYGPAGGTGYAGKPTVPDPQNNRLCPASFPGVAGTGAGMPSFGIFERDFLATGNLAGEGSSQNSTASNIRVSGLTLLPYWGGAGSTYPVVLVGTGYEPRFEKLHIVNGFQGIGFMLLNNNFVNTVEDCFIDQCWDCALYLAEGIGEVRGCRLGTQQMGVIKAKGANYTIASTTAATGNLKGRAAVDLFHGGQPLDMRLERFLFDNEGEFATTEGIIRAEAGGQTRLEIIHCFPGTAHLNAPTIYLAEPAGGVSLPGSSRLTVEGTILDGTGGRAFIVAEGTSWRAKVEGTVPIGKGTAMSMLEYCGADGTSSVSIDDRLSWDYPPNFGLYSRNAASFEAPHKVDGFPYQWDVVGSGGWGASSPAPRAAVPTAGFGGDPAGPPVFRPRAASVATPTGDELGAIGFPDDSVYAALTPDPNALTPTSKVYDYVTTTGMPLKSGPQAQYGRLSTDVRDAMNNYWLRGTAPTLPAGTVRLGRSSRTLVAVGNVDATTAATVGAATWTASSGGVATLAADVTLGVPAADQLPKYSIAQEDATRTLFTALLPGYHSPKATDAAYKLAAGTGLKVVRKLPPYSPLSPRGSFLLWVWDAENNAWLNTGGTLAAPPADLYAGLSTIDLRGATVPPTPAAILAAEATGGGYARAHVGQANFNASANGVTTNSAAISFPTLSGPLSAPAYGVFLTDSATGAGTKGPFFFAQLIGPAVTGTGYTGKAGSTPSFAPGAFTFSR